jgi:hypothetical protein
MALEEIETPTLSLDDLAKTLAAKTSLDEGEADDVLAMLISLYNLPRTTPAQKDSLVSDLLAAIESEKDSLATKEQVEGFAPFIERAMASPAMGTIAKSLLLLGGYEHLFCKATIFTDLRPVFSDEEAGNPSALVASHTLRLSYHARDFSTEDFYVALGRNDLEKLAKVIERARQKEDSLRKFAKDAEIAFLAMEEQC